MKFIKRKLSSENNKRFHRIRSRQIPRHLNPTDTNKKLMSILWNLDALTKTLKNEFGNCFSYIVVRRRKIDEERMNV